MCSVRHLLLTGQVIEMALLHATDELDEVGVVKKCQEGGFCWVSDADKPLHFIVIVLLVLEGSSEELSCKGQWL